jgi:hypothetical protein
MAEAPSQGAPTPPAAPAAAPAEPQPQGLEKVYADFKIEDQAASFQPQSPSPAPQQQAQPQVPPVAPKFDPFDPNFPAHMERVSRAAAEAHTALSQTQQQLTSLQRQLHTEKVEADIKRAVSTLTEGTDIKPRIAEVAMEAKAREDARFRQIWQNRQQNPAAYNAALKAFRQELQDEYTVRQDPQLVENQRAVKAAQQQMATTQKETPNSKWENMTFEERRQEAQRIRRMG